MKLKSTIILFLAMTCISFAKTDKTPVNIENNYFQLSFGKLSGSSYYNFTGSPKTDIYKPISASHDSIYTFIRDSYYFSFDISQMFALDSSNEIGADFGMTYAKNDLENKFKSNNDSTSSVSLLSKNNLLDNINFSLKYRGTFGSFILDVGTNFLIPLAKYKDVKDTIDLTNNMDDKYYEYITSGYSTITPSFNLYYISPKSYLTLNGSYSFNSNQVSDMYRIGLGAGLLTVKDAVLYTNILYSKSTTALDNSLRFNPAKYQLQEESLKIGAGFKLKFMQNTSAGIYYYVTVSGKNTLNNTYVSLFLAYTLNLLNK